ncbi:MAG: DNA polymerase III subunit delta [Nitrospira sp. NTP1]|nr:DNA polymerase III subunit delta [Nitrospira sp. NTP1]
MHRLSLPDDVARCLEVSTSVMSMELPQSLARSGVMPLYAVVGEEDYLRDSSVAALRAAALGAGAETGFNYDIFHGDDSSIADVLAKSVEKLPAREGEKLLSYLASPNESTTFIVVAAKLDGRLKWTQALTKRAVTVNCASLREAQLSAWIRQEAAALGVRLQDDAIQLLKDVGSESLYAVKRELEKLAAYVPPDEPGASVFDLMNAIGAHDHGRAFRILARNVENGEAPLRILGALVWQYRRLWKMKEQLKSGGREGEAARTFRMDPSRVRGFLAQFSDEQMTQAFEWFLEMDSKLKGGSGSTPVRVMEDLLFRLCGKPTKPASAAQRVQPAVPPASRPSGSRPVSNVRTVTRKR